MKRTIELADPRSLRALAHPTRLSLVGLLRQYGTLTATQAGNLLGLNSGNCSFHLRQLAKYGLVEEVTGGRGRNKPWRATALNTSWPDVASGPEMEAAVRLLSGVVVEHYVRVMRQWLDRRTKEPLEWQEAAWFGDMLLHVTPQELAMLGKRIEDLIAPFEPRLTEPERRPAGSRPVTMLHVAIPRTAGASEKKKEPL
jgi:predicted ArsR family transcriptional regulator